MPVMPGSGPQHQDGSPASIDTPFIKVVFQHGPPHSESVNGCRVEDLVDALVEKLLDFQSRPLGCEENDRALFHLHQAKAALTARRRAREQQGVYGSDQPHESAHEG